MCGHNFSKMGECVAEDGTNKTGGKWFTSSFARKKKKKMNVLTPQ